MEKGSWRVASALAFGLVAFAALGSLTWPFGRDQGIFAWSGNVILSGGVPYKDAWDMKGPLTYYIYAFGLGVFGPSMLAIRLLDLAIMLLGVWALCVLVLRLTAGSRFAAASAALFLALAYYGGGFWQTAQGDMWGGLLLLPVIALLLSPRWKQMGHIAAIGGCLALAALLKPTFLAFLALLLIRAIAEPRALRASALPVIACLAIAASVIGGALLFLWQKHAFSDLAQVVQFIASTHSAIDRAGPIDALIFGALHSARYGLAIPVLVAPLGIGYLLARQERVAAIVVASWLSLALVVAVMQGKFWFYHFAPAFVAAAAVTGLSLLWLEQWTSTVSGASWRKLVRAGVLVAIMSPVAARATIHTKFWPFQLLGGAARSSYLERFQSSDGTWRFSEMQAVASYVRGHSSDQECVLVWGWDALINFLAQRKPASRFGFSYPLIAHGPLRPTYQAEFLREVARSAPSFIVIDARGDWALLGRPGLALLQEFPEFERLLREGFVLTETIGTFQIYKRRPG